MAVRVFVLLVTCSLVSLLLTQGTERVTADQPYIQLIPPLAVGGGARIAIYGSGFCGASGCSPVTVKVGNRVVASGVQVGADGRFQASFTVTERIGIYTVEASQTAADGSVLSDFTRLNVPAVDYPSPTPNPSPAPTPPPTPRDARYFPQTGFRVAKEPIWDYFNRRGGVSTFGYPISRPFRLQGFTVQFFQRRAVQLDGSGAPRLLNLLDGELLPYTRFNGSTFPAIDSALVVSAPAAGDADSALAFVRGHAPDVLQDKPVGFYQAFISTVPAQAAFPSGGDPGLLPGFDLEMWGLPTGGPSADPNNAAFIYLRFQRGIMVYDDGCRCTQGVLLVDYLKSILTGANLPPDLEQQSKGSPLYRQYDPSRPHWLRDPTSLPDTDLTNAFVPE